MEAETNPWKCQRCGRCCMHMHSDDTGMPCESLLIEDGIASCQLHGTNLKPDYCIEYPDDEQCWFYKNYRPEGRRSAQRHKERSEARP